MRKADVAAFFDRLAAALPEPKGELEYSNPYTLLVAVVLSAQATDVGVDTHIFRVGNRTGLAPGKTPLEVERKLEKAVPPNRRLHAHHWLILHGRYVCKARKPDCAACLVADLCGYKAKTTAA